MISFPFPWVDPFPAETKKLMRANCWPVALPIDFWMGQSLEPNSDRSQMDEDVINLIHYQDLWGGIVPHCCCHQYYPEKESQKGNSTMFIHFCLASPWVYPRVFHLCWFAGGLNPCLCALDHIFAWLKSQLLLMNFSCSLLTRCWSTMSTHSGNLSFFWLASSGFPQWISLFAVHDLFDPHNFVGLYPNEIALNHETTSNASN